MKFTKMHGLGNDYIYVNCFEERVTDAPTLSRAISDRHRGVGSDGLILICPSNVADVRMEMYNVDGSRAQMCGNGIRCVAKYAYEHGLARKTPMRIETDAGVLELALRCRDDQVESVRVDMGRPQLAPESLPATFPGDRIVDYPVEIAGEAYRVTCVSMGNPHSVVFVDDLDAFDLLRIGPQFECAPCFPERINAHFVQVQNPSRVRMKTWERGSGSTQACGTGASAVCVAGALTGRTQRQIIARLPGGDLELEWAENDHIYMTGPATEVFTGDWPCQDSSM
ncbi:MAG TPA: diaminopimelate epimerase [Phycisphaerae bacterium]